MKAVRFHQRGGPEVLVLEDVPLPEPGQGEARIRVRAAAVNHLDLWVRRGLPIRMEMPHVGGADFAGVIDALGPGASGFHVGDAVVGHPLLAEHDVRPGAPSRSILGEERNGAFCEAITLPTENLVRKPPALSFESAAALPVVFVTAWSMLVDRARLGEGETVLIQGAGSGVGTAAVQIARLRGARVIACTQPAKMDRIRDLGAHEVIDYTTERIDLRVRELTGGHGADVIFEHVGEATWSASISCAAVGGRIVTCGATTGRRAPTDLTLLFARELSIFGVTLGTRETLTVVLDLAAAGRLSPVIDRVLPLERCREAHELLESGTVFGKIVLRTGGSDS